jgi:hypothetical protein
MLRSHPTVRAGLVVLLLSAAARAEPSEAELAAARELFTEARSAEDAGRWQEALSKLQAVARVKTTPQVRFHLGLCEENLGRFVEALNHFERARAEATEQGLGTVILEAKEHATRARARTAKLELAFPAGHELPRVEIDGQPVASVLLVRPLLLDPGKHQVSASSPGSRYTKEVVLTERQALRLEVVLERSTVTVAAADHTRAGATSGRGAGGAPLGGDRDSANVGEPLSSGPAQGRSSTLGWALVGGGGVALAGAVTAALVRSSAINHIESVCPSHTDCPATLETSVNRAKTANILAFSLAIVGTATAGAGLLAVLSAHSAPSTGQITWSPWLSAHGAGSTGAISW